MGGHCIGVDPYYLTAKALELGYNPQVILAGRRINDNMPVFVAQKIIKLIAGDAGRPITDLASELCYPELSDDAREVLRKLAAVEKPIGTRDGRWFTVRIMPYRTQDDRIDGVVITFANITGSKTLEASLRKNQSDLEQHVTRQTTELKRRQRKAKR